MFRQGNPGEGQRGARMQFRYTPTFANQEWTGWLAGPYQWVQAHTSSKGSKPCLTWITHGALPCPRCGPTSVPKCICYVPIYRESDGAPCVVIVHESGADFLEGLNYPRYVRIGRDAGEADTVVVCAALTRKPMRTVLKARQQPADITLSLLTMWNINELTEWYAAQDPLSKQLPVPKIDALTVPTEPTGTVPGVLSRLAAHFEVSAEKADLVKRNAEQAAKWAREKERKQNGNPHA
jgi:hypothetical protein